MPTALEFVFAEEDERLFLDFMSRFNLTAYPDRIPPDYQAIPVRPESQEQLVEPAYYLAAAELAPIAFRTFKKGKDRGWTEIDEIASPVIHYDRSVVDENGELRSGKLWTELNITGDVQRNTDVFPEPYRRMWLQMKEHVVTRSRKSDPGGYFIGGQAARLWKAGTVLRVAGRKGGVLKPHR